MKLSVIIPLFNAEKTLEYSLKSIKCRSVEEVELIFVDDGSTDGTGQHLKSFQDSTPFKCIVLSQKNQGAASARNKAIDAASGDYLVFMDADDKLKENALNSLLELTDNNTDIIGWDWENFGDKSTRLFKQADYNTPKDAIKNMMGGNMKWNLWLFSIKKSLIIENGIKFIPGADMGEDMQFVLKAFCYASSVLQTHEVLYMYNSSNPASISNMMNERRRKEVSVNLAAIEAFVPESMYSDLLQEMMPQLKLYIKRPLLIGTSFTNYKIWYDWFPEVNRFSSKNKELAFHTRLLQGLASHRLFVLVWIYNILVYKLVYRIAFR